MQPAQEQHKLKNPNVLKTPENSKFGKKSRNAQKANMQRMQ